SRRPRRSWTGLESCPGVRAPGSSRSRAETRRMPAPTWPAWIGLAGASLARAPRLLGELDGGVGVVLGLFGEVRRVGVAGLGRLELGLLEVLFGEVILVRCELIGPERLGLRDARRRGVDDDGVLDP